MLIRQAIDSDAENLEACMHAAYSPYLKQIGEIRLPPLQLDYLSEIQNCPTWVAESEKQILGGLTMLFEKEVAVIANIAVNPSYQGQGVGGKLMRFAESQAIANNCHQLKLATHVLLKDNISLYQHLGWQEISRNQEKVLMSKQL